MTHSREIERLLLLEYGDRFETAFRFGAVLIAGVTVFLYTGWWIAWLWLAAFFGLHLANYCFLRRRRHAATAADTLWASGIFLVLLVVFVSVPAALAMHSDPAMRIGGSTMIGTVLVFIVRRADTLRFMIAGQIAIVVAVVCGVHLWVLQKVDSPLAAFAVVFSAFGLLVYFIQALLLVRKNRLQAEAAAERLAQEQKMAAIGQLAGGVAHDFNNILTAVLGNLDLYAEARTDADRTAFVDNARTAAARAGTVVEQLLVYARQSRGDLRPTEANALLNDLLAPARRLIPAFVRLKVQRSDADLWIEVDRDQLLTALTNLVVNATDAMSGGGVLTVRAEKRQCARPMISADGTLLPAGAYVALSVADTGPGIAPQMLDRVVEPFFTTKPVGKGSGLGLAMVLGFARISGGGLRIESSPSGTVATVLLPQQPAPGPRRPVASAAPDGRRPPPPPAPQPADVAP